MEAIFSENVCFWKMLSIRTDSRIANCAAGVIGVAKITYGSQRQLQSWDLSTEISPVLHTGGEGVHTSSDSADGETRLDNWVRVEKHSLDHIQNICVSVQTVTFTNE